MADDPLWINASAGAPAYSADELRRLMAVPLQYDGRLVGGRQGVRPGGDQLRVSLSVSTITVQPGLAVVDPGLTSTQGPYWVSVDTAQTHTLAAADASNPRKDIVIVRIYDHDADTSGQRKVQTEYLAGTAAPSPSEPAVPLGAMKLATIDVPASPGAAVVTDQRRPLFAGPEMVVFTAGGTFSKASYPWARRAKVRLVGGGGSGGGCPATGAGETAEGGGGGAGGYCEGWFDVWALPTSVTVTVGAGGTAAASAAAGQAGGTSSFGSLMSASGGDGGNAGVNSSTAAISGGGNGGTSTGGQINLQGGDGGNGRVVSGIALQTGYGAESMLSGAAVVRLTNTTGDPGRSYGGGSSGANSSASNAAKGSTAGGAGIVIVELY
jgi:hypothetical protein